MVPNQHAQLYPLYDSLIYDSAFIALITMNQITIKQIMPYMVRCETTGHNIKLTKHPINP